MTKVSDKDYRKISRYIDDLKTRLVNNSLDFEEFKNKIGPLIGQFPKTLPIKTQFLRQTETLIIPATSAGNGQIKETSAFYAIDFGYKENFHETIYKDTKAMEICVYDLITCPASLDEIYASLGCHHTLLEIETSEQINKLVETHPHLWEDRRGPVYFSYQNIKRQKRVVRLRKMSHGIRAEMVNLIAKVPVCMGKLAQFVVAVPKS